MVATLDFTTAERVYCQHCASALTPTTTPGGEACYECPRCAWTCAAPVVRIAARRRPFTRRRAYGAVSAACRALVDAPAEQHTAAHRARIDALLAVLDLIGQDDPAGLAALAEGAR